MNALEVLNQTRDAMTARRVYGEPYQQDGVTVIPAANVWGGGGGGGDTEGNGGGGFGVVAPPAGATACKGGVAEWRSWTVGKPTDLACQPVVALAVPAVGLSLAPSA